MLRLFLSFALLFRLCFLQAQVLVHEEPRHHPVFQNDKIRILNVLLPPGDTTQYHIHHTPSLFLFFTSTTTGSQLQGAEPSTGRSTAGNFLFENLSAPHQRIHRVWNMDKDTFHVMDIELLLNDSGFKQAPLKMELSQLVVDASWVRAYQLTLRAGEAFSIQHRQHSLVLISMVAGPVQAQQAGDKILQAMRPGSFFWIKAGQQFALQNTGGTSTQFALLELP